MEEVGGRVRGWVGGRVRGWVGGRVSGGRWVKMDREGVWVVEGRKGRWCEGVDKPTHGGWVNSDR